MFLKTVAALACFICKPLKPLLSLSIDCSIVGRDSIYGRVSTINVAIVHAQALLKMGIRGVTVTDVGGLELREAPVSDKLVC